MADNTTRQPQPAAPFNFPTLTQDRAEHIADALLSHSPSDDRVLLLAAELALGLAPENPSSSEDLDRSDAARAFVERAFRNVRAFEDYCDGLRRLLADPERRRELYDSRDSRIYAREYGQTGESAPAPQAVGGLRPLAAIYQDLGEAIAAVLDDDRTPVFLYNSLADLLTETDNMAGSPGACYDRDVAHARYFFARLAELATNATIEEETEKPTETPVIM